MGRVLGSWVMPPMDQKKPFLKYTVPAIELRRLLWEARDAKENFKLVYTQLPGVEGDEEWRTSGKGTLVTVQEDGKGWRKCLAGGQTCREGEIAMLPRLGFWERSIGVWNPHPIVPGMQEELMCFGP